MIKQALTSLAAIAAVAAATPAAAAPARVDLVTIGVPDLGAATDRIEALTGVRPAYGGVHSTRGTLNALLALGDNVYLEILAAHPGSAPPAELKDLKRPTILWWGFGVSDAAATRAAL